MKTTAKIGKRSLLLAILVGVLGVAVYCNWYLSNNPEEQTVTDVLTGSTMGQAMYVNAQADSTQSQEDDYFAETRKNREETRKKANEALLEIINNVKSNKDGVEEATKKAGVLAMNMEKETNIETLVKAKGFANCVAVISEEAVSVIVKSSGLLPSDMVQIQEIAREQTGFSLENIKIIESK